MGAEPELDVIIRLPRAGSCDKITIEREKRSQEAIESPRLDRERVS